MHPVLAVICGILAALGVFFSWILAIVFLGDWSWLLWVGVMAVLGGIWGRELFGRY